MINVSSEFKEIMMQRQDFKENAEVTFSDGTVLNLEEKDFSISNNGVVDAADTNAVPIGAALCRSIQIELLNDDDHLESYDFYGAKVRLYLTFTLSDTVEKIEFGTFTVTSPECYGTAVTVDAFDDMYKANMPYSTDLSFPATAGAVLRDACSRCNILIGTAAFLHDDFQIQTKPSGDYTFRQIIGYIAMIACGNARINRNGKLEILTYDLDFTRGYHNLTEWKSLTVDTSDITITGIQTTRKVKKTEGEKETEVEETVRAGSEGYMLTVSNPLASGNEEALVSWINERIAGIPFRKFTGDYITYPLVEFMDLAKITDWRGNTYNTFVTDVNFVFFGITTLKNSAESGLRNASTYGNSDAQTKIYLQDLINQERSERQEAIKKLGDSLNAGGGLYSTYEKQPDGSTITYLHDKPTLGESKTVIKITSEAIGVSQDGGKTYLYGFVLDGDMITRILYAHGIDADYINTGAITVRDAETKEIIFSVDIDTGKVIVSGDIIQIGGKKLGSILDDLDERIKKSGNIVMQLDNEYQGIPADWQGNITSFPTVQTTVQVFYGQQDISASCTYSVNKSDGITGRWDNTRRTYTVTGLSTETGWIDIAANYLGIFNVTKRFNVSKNKDGMPGANGVGITEIKEYFAVSTSNVHAPSDWQTDPPQTTGIYKYLWNYETIYYSNGTSKDTDKKVIGVHGESGANGKGIKNVINYYLASSNSSGITTSTYGWTTSPQNPTLSKKYLWNYETVTYSDNSASSTEPHIIGVYGDTGDAGRPGRTYFVELSLQAFKRGQDGLLTPDEITARGYYREGDSPDKHSYAGRFQLQASTDGKTYTTISSSSTDVSGQRFTQLNTVSKNYIFFRVNFYHPGGFTNLIDYQTIPVLMDIAALSKDDILDLITDSGKWQGFYKGPDGNVYISFEAARGGLLKLGGVNNGNGRLEIYDNRGNLMGRSDNNGITFFYDHFINGTTESYKGVEFSKNGIRYVQEAIFEDGSNVGYVTEPVITFSSNQDGMDGMFKKLEAVNTLLDTVKVKGVSTFNGASTFTNGLDVTNGSVNFYGWKFPGRYMNSLEGGIQLSDINGVKMLKSSNFRILYGLDLYLSGQTGGGGDFGDGGEPFLIHGLGTGNGSNLVIVGNTVCRTSSSKRYKTIGRAISDADIEKWYQIQPVWAKYKNEFVTRQSGCFNTVMPMLIAEDVEKYLPTAAVKNEEGLTDDWSERILIPAMFAMIKSQKEQIDTIKKEIEELKESVKEEIVK